MFQGPFHSRLSPKNLARNIAGTKGRSGKRMVPASAGTLSPLRCQNWSQVSGGKNQLLDLHPETGVEKGEGPDEPYTSLSGSWVFEPRKIKTEEWVPPPELRPVLPRGSMIQENLTLLATIETRSLGLPTTFSTATQSVATHDEFHDGQGLIAAVALHPWGLQNRATKTPAPHQSDHCTGS